ncbi:Lipopolysaccharide assembly protein B [bacterium HR36]|nr:Lipopolysaccharide assembly protein B [bacterium HR36]
MLHRKPLEKVPVRPATSAWDSLRCALVAAGVFLLGCGKTVQEQVVEHNRTGVGYLVQHQYVAAEEQFRQALQLAPEDLTAHYNLAVAAHLRGQNEQAEQHYRYCLLQDPLFLPARRALAQLLWHQGRQRELEALIVPWVRDRPNSADAQALYGWYLARLGDYPAAAAALDRALALDPQNAFALAERGRIYEIYRYPERARSLYERSLQHDPWQPELRARLTRLRFHRPALPP